MSKRTVLTLPKIQILITLTSQSDLNYQEKNFPPFSGDPFQFQAFWEIFDSSIHSNTSLATINKFSYLKTLLTGKVKDALNSFELTSENYDEAVVILKSRFEEPQVVIQTNVDILLALHPVSSSSNITELRKIYDAVESVSRNFTTFWSSCRTFWFDFNSCSYEKKKPTDFRLEVAI